MAIIYVIPCIVLYYSSPRQYMVSFVLSQYYALQYVLISASMHKDIFVVAWLVFTLLRASYDTIKSWTSNVKQ